MTSVGASMAGVRFTTSAIGHDRRHTPYCRPPATAGSSVWHRTRRCLATMSWIFENADTGDTPHRPPAHQLDRDNEICPNFEPRKAHTPGCMYASRSARATARFNRPARFIEPIIPRGAPLLAPLRTPISDFPGLDVADAVACMRWRPPTVSRDPCRCARSVFHRRLQRQGLIYAFPRPAAATTVRAPSERASRRHRIVCDVRPCAPRCSRDVAHHRGVGGRRH